MPRFFFDFRQAGVLTRDNEGLEFATVEHAYLEAAEGAREMWGEFLRKRQDPRRCSFEVRNQGDQLLFVFQFQEVLDACGSGSPVLFKRTFDEACAIANAAKRAHNEFRSEIFKMHDTLKQSRALLSYEI